MMGITVGMTSEPRICLSQASTLRAIDFIATQLEQFRSGAVETGLLFVFVLNNCLPESDLADIAS
jgi:hypothetical protein